MLIPTISIVPSAIYFLQSAKRYIVFYAETKGALMQKTIQTRQHASQVKTFIVHLNIEGLLAPGQKLALNLRTRTLSLLCEGPEQIMEQQFSSNEMRVLVPILQSFPHYCPYEVLLAHMSANNPTTHAITHCRQRLQDALENGSWPQEVRPIRRALSSLRTKLHHFNLEVSTIRERGCGLTSLTITPNRYD